MEMNGNLFSRYHNTDTLIRSFLFLIFPALILKSLMAEPYQYFCFNVSIWHFLSSQILRKKQICWERFKGIRAPSGTTIQAATLIFFQLECSAKKILVPTPPPSFPRRNHRFWAGFWKKTTCFKKQERTNESLCPPKKWKYRTNFRGSQILSTFWTISLIHKAWMDGLVDVRWSSCGVCLVEKDDNYCNCNQGKEGN